MIYIHIHIHTFNFQFSLSIPSTIYLSQPIKQGVSKTDPLTAFLPPLHSSLPSDLNYSSVHPRAVIGSVCFQCMNNLYPSHTFLFPQSLIKISIHLPSFGPYTQTNKQTNTSIGTSTSFPIIKYAKNRFHSLSFPSLPPSTINH